MMIPIENLYFLLCYAWNRLEEGEVVRAGMEGTTTLADLFGHVLAQGTAHLLKRGLDEDYEVQRGEIRGVRGKVDLGLTLKRNLRAQGRTHCVFDERSADVLHNRILKTTLGKLEHAEGLDPELRHTLHGLRRRMGNVSEVRVTPAAFRAVKIHRNNRFYDFLLHVCRLVHTSAMITQTEGVVRFRDFVRDERRMAGLFQHFVLNFLKREQQEYKVKARRLAWHGASASASAQDLSFLPVMQTDVVLRSPHRTLVIDTKYYRSALKVHRGRPKVQSAHLYQVFAYLKNLQPLLPDNSAVEGMLLYPTVNESFRLRYRLCGHLVQVCTLNLAQPWQRVGADLLSLVTEEGASTDVKD